MVLVVLGAIVIHGTGSPAVARLYSASESGESVRTRLER
jgi:hypothetical protein